MPTFTPTQGRYLSFIHTYIEGFGLPPAESEIAEAMGVQPPSVNGMMKTLEKKQLIRRKPGVARSIEILIDPTTLPKWKKKISRTVYEWQPTKNSPQWGYAEFIEAISDPTHHQHEDMLQWSGPFDPDEFDPEQATSMMAEGFPVWY